MTAFRENVDWQAIVGPQDWWESEWLVLRLVLHHLEVSYFVVMLAARLSNLSDTRIAPSVTDSCWCNCRRNQALKHGDWLYISAAWFRKEYCLKTAFAAKIYEITALDYTELIIELNDTFIPFASIIFARYSSVGENMLNLDFMFAFFVHWNWILLASFVKPLGKKHKAKTLIL